jgi:hypothetical protein
MVLGLVLVLREENSGEVKGVGASGVPEDGGWSPL